ncbi:hypothetical protein FXN63_05935 [Pigmentiphaga aceris]|uniref:Uncharacterized protein n=1 Tax=Pigmentiphaga aceris TaxID=1940612 RepID=A0A5C0AXX0_9BURK|nr:hypothetical protein [Pigmentiphaga aceris]QEI05431.1 hypothetical protein FXN63_05935 [Pigmentiphaga aceris]
MSRPPLAAPLAAALVALALLGGCKAPLSLAEPTPVHGRVVDRRAFDAFIATQPGPFEFRRLYPDVTLVLPQDMATQEVRSDNSRFFARLNADGKIVSGEFR